MALILHDSNAAVRLVTQSLPVKPVIMPHSACAFQRATKLAGNERKVFILHDEGENATAARMQTMAFAKLLDQNQIVPYYRNAPHKSVLHSNEDWNGFKCSWYGQSSQDTTKTIAFIRETVFRKGPYFSLIGLGQTRRLLQLVAKEHDIRETPPTITATGPYPVTIVTLGLFTTFYVPAPNPFSLDATAALPFTRLPNEFLLSQITSVINNKENLYNFKRPTLAQLRAEKQAKKLALERAARQCAEDFRIYEELKRRFDAGEDVVVPPKPVSGRAKRQRRKLEEKMAELWGKDPNASGEEECETNVPLEEVKLLPATSFSKHDGYSHLTKEQIHGSHDLVSNYISAPAAEPVAPCPVEQLDEMIHWLEKDEDITVAQEPRIDFIRGSILGKTTQGGGTSVDLCKQVVGPKGIKPILDAVGKNSHIDRFLLGNNIVGNEGAQVIADFIASERSKHVYNFYIAGNSIGPEGISAISSSLATNQTVTALWLKRNPLMPQGARHLSMMLMTNTTLQTLDLVNTGITDAGTVAIFRALKQNPTSPLKHIYLGSNAEGPRTGQAVGDFLASGQSKLTSLTLSCSRLGDEGVSYIAAGLQNDSKLERLALESTRIGDVGAKALADALAGHPALIMLDLGYRKGTYEMGERGNEITDEGAMYLGEKLIGKPGARKSNTLRSIDLSSNSISKEGQHQFFNDFVVSNDKLLRVRLGQKGSNWDPKVELACKRLVNEYHSKYFEAELTSEEEIQERERVRDALEPQHIKEIYSIYRGNM